MIVIEENDEALEDFCPIASLSYCFRFQVSSSTYQHSVDDGCAVTLAAQEIPKRDRGTSQTGVVCKEPWIFAQRR